MERFKNVLITGGCGFIGSNFINYIFSTFTGNIINVDRIDYCSDENNIKEGIRNSNRYSLYKEDIKNKEEIQRILSKHSIDLIVHFAAQSHVTNSFAKVQDFIDDNIIATYNLLECSRNYSSLKLFIHISTDEVYGDSSLLPNATKKTENIQLDPTNPYSATKAAAEMLARSFIHSFKLPIIITRCNNVYGPNQYAEKVIPKFIKQIRNGEKITIEGNGYNKRTFIHSEDVSSALHTIISRGKTGEIYNIGNNNDEYTIMEMAEILLNIMKPTSKIEDNIIHVTDRPYNDTRYYIDYSKLNELGWSHTKNLKEEIKKLI